MNDIKLAATQGSWRLFMTRKADDGFKQFANKVHLRDKYECQFCGFSSSQRLDVINLDGNYRNNKISNLVTSCPLCAQCHFLDSVGQGDFGGGTLIYLPEITQAQLNATCHIIFSSIASGGHYSQNAKDMYRQLKMRAKIIEKKLGEGLSNPSIYGQMLIDASQKAHAVHKDLSNYIRLLPNLKKFAPLVNRWLNLSIDAMA